MKKILFLAALVCAMIGVTSCNSCKKGEEKPANVDTVLVVEDLVKADCDAMAKDYNPQYIFGNVKAQIYVDAVTGNVTDKNPAYEGVNLGTPLGEWP